MLPSPTSPTTLPGDAKASMAASIAKPRAAFSSGHNCCVIVVAFTPASARHAGGGFAMANARASAPAHANHHA